jgi:hypothetical protein
MQDEVFEGPVPWEFYVRFHNDGTAHGNVYLGTDLIYRTFINAETTAIWDEDEPFTLKDAVSITQSRFANTLWKVLFDAQPDRHKG